MVELVRRLYPGVDFDFGIVVARRARGLEKEWGELSVARWKAAAHHRAHAAVAFYQSSFDRALVISYDGGGNDGWFRTFIASRKDGVQYLDDGIRINLGSAYGALAVPIQEIHTNASNTLPNAGKLMGLAAYGAPRAEWRQAIREFYIRTLDHSGRRIRQLPTLGAAIGLDLSGPDTISGQDAYDFAATGQAVFEEIFFEHALPTIAKYKLPVCLSGGCALNVITNEKLARTIDYPVFVPPNPNDCGLPLGAILQHFPPQYPIQITYAGVPLLDAGKLDDVCTEDDIQGARIENVARLLALGNIVGVARGNSEHGPRALGNRSLLCDPGNPQMKDRLNVKVKFRESFRPYAPVVRRCDAAKYFDCLDYDMSYMSFNPTVRPEWRHRIPAIVHADQTARVQTVTREQNRWLFDLLTAFEVLTGYGVLLNTSFNTKGKPILSTVAEVLENLAMTDIDYAIVEDRLISSSKVRDRNVASRVPI
ncbi:MAG: hypothetical protein J0M17_18020 [Planctomycetes bacterium]|nr:hypothetical protein [Planctomycetota bacterium]